MKILDCTLRDGGYYTNWNFKKNLVNQYLEAMNAINVDYVEIGFRFIDVKKNKNTGFYTSTNQLASCRESRSPSPSLASFTSYQLQLPDLSVVEQIENISLTNFKLFHHSID